MSVKKGSNFIALVLDSRLLVAINGKASSKGQLNATYIMGLLVEHCQDDLDPNAYQELKERYAKTIQEQYTEKHSKEKEKLERERIDLDLRERELKTKERELDIRAENAKLRTDKFEEPKRKQEHYMIEQELRKRERYLEGVKNKPKTAYVEKVEKETAELKQKLADLKK